MRNALCCGTAVVMVLVGMQGCCPNHGPAHSPESVPFVRLLGQEVVVHGVVEGRTKDSMLIVRTARFGLLAVKPTAHGEPRWVGRGMRVKVAGRVCRTYSPGPEQRLVDGIIVSSQSRPKGYIYFLGDAVISH